MPLRRVEFKFSAVEQDRDSVVGKVSEATSIGFDGLDLRVEPLHHRVGDVVA